MVEPESISVLGRMCLRRIVNYWEVLRGSKDCLMVVLLKQLLIHHLLWIILHLRLDHWTFRSTSGRNSLSHSQLLTRVRKERARKAEAKREVVSQEEPHLARRAPITESLCFQWLHSTLLVIQARIAVCNSDRDSRRVIVEVAKSARNSELSDHVLTAGTEVLLEVRTPLHRELVEPRVTVLVNRTQRQVEASS